MRPLIRHLIYGLNVLFQKINGKCQKIRPQRQHNYQMNESGGEFFGRDPNQEPKTIIIFFKKLT